MALQDLTLGGTRQGTGNEVFGIDLGTTYSAIAWLDENGKATILPNAEGDNTTPSVVYFETPKNIVVGEVAKDSIAIEPEKVVSLIKREMGRTDFFVDGTDETGAPKKWSPIEISACILRKLAQDASAMAGCDVKKVIITCPAYFGTEEHKATRLAGEAAGLEVLNIINEPTAAALAYGVKLNEPKTFVVYDLGGGTFDVTIVKVEGNQIKNICTGGDQRLGGGDWDRAFVDYLVNRWREQTGCQDPILDDVRILNQLMLLAEKNKKLLSGKEKVKVAVAPEGYDKAIVEVSREEFDKITEHLLNQTIDATNQMLEDAAKKTGVDKFEFDELLMVGGSTYMPQVAARLEKEYGKKPVVFDPNQAVAKGAAIFASLPPVEGPVPPPVINILSKSYGIVAKSGGKDVAFNLLLKQQPQTDGKQNASFVQRFGTDVPNQNSILIKITEGEVGLFVENSEITKEQRIADVEDVSILQTARLELPPGLPAHDPIDVKFEIDADMVLNVSAAHVATGKKIDIKVEGVKMEKPALSDGITID